MKEETIQKMILISLWIGIVFAGIYLSSSKSSRAEEANVPAGAIPRFEVVEQSGDLEVKDWFRTMETCIVRDKETGCLYILVRDKYNTDGGIALSPLVKSQP